jgi:hypothetical protein
MRYTKGERIFIGLMFLSCADGFAGCRRNWFRRCSGNKIGDAGDEQISRLAVTQHMVVTIPADIPIYVVLEQTQKPNVPGFVGPSQVARRALKNFGSFYSCRAN